jgi:long-chain acyl-CoA synthetase
MSVHQLLSGAVQRAPHATAIRHAGLAVTWADFADRVARRAAWLHELGLQRGARVAVLAANVPENMEAGFATVWAGMVLVPLNTRLSSSELKFILEHAGCDLMLFDERHAGRAEELASVRGLRGERLAPVSEWTGSADRLSTFKPLPFTPATPLQTAAIFYTGGTTGLPKGCELSHVALLIQGLGATDNCRFNGSSVLVHTAPMFHLAAYNALLGVTAVAGACSFLPEFSPTALLDSIEHEGSNATILVPTMIPAVLDAAKARPGTLARLRNIFYGAAPIQEPILRRLMLEAPEVGLSQMYGQSELGGACTLLPPERHVLEGPLSGKTRSAGRAMSAFSLRVVDESGQPCPAGVSGEIQVSGPGLMTSYWRDPAMTAAAIQDGWLRTGDIGVLDDEGFVSIVGRLKDMIISGGENVFAGEVENILMHHDAIEACAVFGVPDAKWGEAVHAAVVLKKGRSATAAELIGYCREKIAHYKCPQAITIRAESLPLSGVGKVRKVDLLAQWKKQHQPEIGNV